jgi:hypothetical protein
MGRECRIFMSEDWPVFPEIVGYKRIEKKFPFLKKSG